MSWRHARVKRDGNEPEIVDALRAAGVVVVRHTPVLPREGHPEDKGLDLIVGYRGRVVWIEVKDPASRGRARRADEEDQRAFATAWPGQCAVVTSAAEALSAIGAPFPDD